MRIQLAVHQQHVVAEFLGGFYLGVLCFGIGCIERNYLLVLVGLFCLDALAVILETEILSVGVLQQGKVHRSLAELLVGEHAVFYEELEVIPFLLELLALLLEYFFQAVGHLLGDVGADLLHVRVALQVSAAYVQGDVRGVYHAVEQGQKIRNYVVYMVGDEHLVAVELYLVLVDGHALLDLGEVEHAGEVEGVVYVQMDPEHGLLFEGVEGLVEVLVVFVLQFRRGLCPDGVYVVYDVVFVLFYLLAVFPLGLFAENDRNRHELAVFTQQLGDAALGCELVAVVVEMEGDDRAAVCLFAVFHVVFRRTVASPFHGLGAFLPGEGVDSDFFAHHERGIESETEVADDVLVLVFLEELTGGRECNLVYILVDFFGGHAYAVVDYLQGLFLLVQFDLHLEVAQFALEFTVRSQNFQLLRCVHCVCHQLAQENLVV